jgi:hypothetical protein
MFETAIKNVQIRYFIDHDNDHRKTTFVSGMGRSGTTWLAELLNYRNDNRLIFEPFDPSRVALAVNFQDHLYLRPEDDDRRYLAPARAIVTGFIREPFADQHNRKIFCDRRIVKEVRASLFLRWLYRHFPGMPIVMIVRHPFAVAASRLATDEDEDLDAQFEAQPDLVHDYLEPYLGVMRGCATAFERHVASWCIEMGVPLSQFSPGEIAVVFYEHLCTEPARVLHEIFEHVGRPLDARVLKQLSKPSPTTLSPERLAGDWSIGGQRITQAWRERVSATQIRRGLDIIDQFGLESLYGDQDMPMLEVPPLGIAFGASVERAKQATQGT